jgi:hypothetical protein
MMNRGLMMQKGRPRRALGLPHNPVGFIFLGAALLRPASAVFLLATTCSYGDPPPVAPPVARRPPAVQATPPPPRHTAIPTTAPRPLCPPATNPPNPIPNRASLPLSAVIYHPTWWQCPHRPHSPDSVTDCTPPPPLLNSNKLAAHRSNSDTDLEQGKNNKMVGPRNQSGYSFQMQKLIGSATRRLR